MQAVYVYKCLTYGALMEAREVGDASVGWLSQDPEAHQLSGVWSHSYSLWPSREHHKAKDLSLALEATCLNGEDTEGRSPS